MAKKLRIGKVREDYKQGSVSGEALYLEKHSWDCDWYWGFGYVGNAHLHTHFDGAFLGNSTTAIKDIFEFTPLNQDDWWILRDLFIQAYALKKCAGAYRNGGHQTSREGITDMIRDKEMENRLNKDLEIVLDKIWEIVESANNRKNGGANQ